MELIFLKDIIITFGLAIAVILVCNKLRIPTLVALLITGLISGPNALGIIQSASEVEPLAEMGIAFLMFSIGIELSLRRFLRGIKQILMGGGIQVLLTLFFGTATALLFGRPIGEAVFLGCLLSLSSTAIVMTLLQERGEIETPSGFLSISVLIFQDVIVVPMLLIVPLLAGLAHTIDITSFWYLLAESIVILLIVLLAGHWLVPKLLNLVALTKDTRLFLLTVLFICLSVAWLTSSLGLSFALGAFLSGLIISESEYKYHTLGNILPFQEVFTCFFFISTGMLLDSAFVLQYPFLIFGCVISIAMLKATTTSIAALATGCSLITALATGLTLCQVGEFSFLLLKSGIAHNISTPFYYQLFLAVTLFSMAMTPLMIHLAPLLIKHLLDRGWLPHPAAPKSFVKVEEDPFVDHVVIAGFGASGHRLAYALKMMSVPYVILDKDPQIVQSELTKGEPIVFGDASHASVLDRVNIQAASILTVVINDKGASRRIIVNARRTYPNLYIIACASNVSDVKRLRILGANEIIHKELEASIEVFKRVMRKRLTSNKETENIASRLRSSENEMFLDLS